MKKKIFYILFFISAALNIFFLFTNDTIDHSGIFGFFHSEDGNKEFVFAEDNHYIINSC